MFYQETSPMDVDDPYGSVDSSSEDDDEVIANTKDVKLTLNDTLTVRGYQDELYKCAKNKNSILVLGTGSGKTYISILLIKEFADEIRKSWDEGGKRTVFVVNTVPLVYQQGTAIKTHTGLVVGEYEGSRGVDLWDNSQWKEQIEKHEVIILTAQILLELVLHARLPLRRVNLLIVDECHHAVGSHPMREVMRQYDTLKETGLNECPRVLGLTASVINKKCKIHDVSKNMHELEMTMDCALVTSIHQDEVKQFTTRPKEKLVMYRVVDTLTRYQEMVKAQLLGIMNEVYEMEDLDDKIKKFVKKRINNIEHIMMSLGDWCVSRAVYYEMNSLEESAAAEEIPVVREFLQNLRTRFQQIYTLCAETETSMENPKDHVSHKVLRLIEILTAIKEDNVAGLIFVERRNSAKILYDFFIELARHDEDMRFVKPLYVVGTNSRPGLDIKLAERELRKQRDTLKKFKDGEANFIISTSVLEEGVDVRKCNAVIRFDKPVNYRAYVQSRGRARAVPSRYVLMIQESDHIQFINDLDVYREIEKTLLTLCHDRDLPTREEIRRHFDEDDPIPPYEPYGPQGPKVTSLSAISLVNHYIGKLPQDKFTILAPDVIYRKRDDGKVQAGILLPVSAGLKDRIYGPHMESKDLAKRSAALYLCQLLHRMGELDNKLRPTVATPDQLANDLLGLDLQSEGGKIPGLGTKRHRQIYEKELCKSLSHNDGNKFYLYSIEMKPVGEDSREIVVDSSKCEANLGILSRKELVHCPFSLFGGKIGEVSINLKCLDASRSVHPEEIKEVEHFHKLAFESLMPINESLMEFDPKGFGHGTFIVPLKNDNIYSVLINKLMHLTSVRSGTPKFSLIYRFDRSLFEDAVVFPLYKEESQSLFYITGVMEHLNPMSEFPESKMMYENYEGYFMSKYNARITNKQQPLLAVKHLPKELNYLKRNISRKKKSSREPPNYIPELCGVIPFKASLWWQLSCVPSILYRINTFGLAYSLNLNISDYPLHDLSYITNRPLDFEWTSSTAQSSEFDGNLAVGLARKRNGMMYPFMLAHALTLLGSNDGYNLERLEVLGDSFLKYAAAEYVYLKFPDEHEGKLSGRRTIIVCNKTLYMLARKKLIPTKIQSVVFQPKVNGILPGFGVKKAVEERLLILKCPHDKWHKLSVPSNLSNLEQAIQQATQELEDGEIVDPKPCYNPWCQHEVSDKSVADCIEALIGAYLLQCGSDAAKDFLHWIGIGISKGKQLLKDALPVRTAVIREVHWAQKEVESLYMKACLDRLENVIKYNFKDKSFIVQAVTHPSYIQNKITDTYQRLEFIGDAVLDYLVTGLIYARHTSYTPGQLTDLRSYYVNNETLAKVAAKFKLQKHLLHMAPKLQASIDKFLGICTDEEDLTRDLITEDDEDDVDEIEVPKCLGDLVEAITGAVYLDSGRNLKVAWDVLLILMGDVFEKRHDDIPKNCVRQLYEIADKVVFTKVKHEVGDLLASYDVMVNDFFEIRGSGKNFKVAKESAAKKALRRLKIIAMQGNK